MFIDETKLRLTLSIAIQRFGITMRSSVKEKYTKEDQQALVERYIFTREQTVYLSTPLSEADMTIQAADFVSPSKWHLAHTTWFFEEFFLRDKGFVTANSETYRFLFNSYYETIGNRQIQGKRGLITRPTLIEVMDYRKEVDEAVIKILNNCLDSKMLEIIDLGINHEQQHQELFLTDILYTLAQNPTYPAYRRDIFDSNIDKKQTSMSYVPFDGGLDFIGHTGFKFAFDNEFPKHNVYLEPFQLANRLVTNGEWIDFIEDGGYQTPLLWLVDGWRALQTDNWQMPLYWTNEGCYKSMTLSGLQTINLNAPVTHISYFEADAFARWANKRLPTEMEWEVAARTQKIQGNFMESKFYLPKAPANTENILTQMYGDVWQWTASPYIAYPGFKALVGAVGEYNGKFMNGQYVLRGGSCVSPREHLRSSYRNFFYPHQRWQFSGLRLAI